MTSDGLQHRLAVALEGGDHRGWLGRIVSGASWVASPWPSERVCPSGIPPGPTAGF